MRSIRKSSKSNLLSSSGDVNVFSTDDVSTQEVLEVVAKKLGCDNLHDKWYEVLKENLFDDKISSLEEVTPEDWVAMSLPVRVLVEMRRVVREKKKEFESISSSKSPRPETIIPMKADRTFSTNSTSSEKKRKSHKKNHSIGESKGFTFPNLNLNASGGHSNTPAQNKGISINIVGDESITNPFRKTSAMLFSRNLNMQGDMENYGLISAYDEKVKLQFFCCPGDAETNCSLIVFLFSVSNPQTLDYLKSNLQVHLPTFREKRIVEIPIILIGIETAERENVRIQNKKVITSVAGERAATELNALMYLELSGLKDLDEFEILITRLAQVAIRYESSVESTKYSSIASEIQKASEMQSVELVLKRKQLKYVPPTVLYLQHLQRLRLSNNFIRYFPTELKYLPHLVELDLSYNSIDELPVGQLLCFPSLLKLDLEYNKLESLPIKDLQSMQLQELKTKGNPLSSLPPRLRAKNNILDVKPANPPKKLPVFGVRIEQKLEEDRYHYPYLLVPYFADVAFNWIISFGLCKEGIFRLQGKGNVINKLRDTFTSSTDIRIPKDTDPTVVASLLKQYIRELPEPPLTFDRFNDIVSVVNLKQEEQRVKLKEIIRSLPKEYYNFTKTIFHLIHLVSLHAEVNLMNTSNLCKMLAPNLLRQPPSKEIDISSISCTHTAIEAIAENYNEIFEAPEFSGFTDQIAQVGILFHRKLQLHKHQISYMTFSDDQKYIWTADVAGNCFIWLADTYEVVERLEITNKKINVLCAVLDCMWIGTCTSIHICDAKNGRHIKDIEGEAFFHSIIKVNVDVWMSRGTCIHVLSKTGDLKTQFPTSLITALCKVSDFQVWVSTSDHKIQIWNINTHEMVEEFPTSHDRKINEIKLMSTSEVWTMGDDGVICVWDTRSLSRLHRLTNYHTSKVFGACRIGGSAWSFSWDSEIHIWDIENCKHIQKLASLHNDPITQVMSRWNPTFECWEVFTASYDKSMIVWLVQDKVNSKAATPIRYGSRESLMKTKSNEVGTLNLEALNNNDYSDCDDSTSTRSDNSEDATPKSGISRFKLDLSFDKRSGNFRNSRNNSTEEIKVVNPLLSLKSSTPS